MARGLFNLTNLVRRSDSFEGKTRSEIHSITPREVPYNARTKLTIRGSNLAISRLDVLKIVVIMKQINLNLKFIIISFMLTSSRFVAWTARISWNLNRHQS